MSSFRKSLVLCLHNINNQLKLLFLIFEDLLSQLNSMVSFVEWLWLMLLLPVLATKHVDKWFAMSTMSYSVSDSACEG